MSKGTLKNGFEYSIADDAYDNWDLLEILEAIDEGKTEMIVKAYPMLIGKEQFDNLKSYIKERDGRVSILAMVECFTEMIEQVKDGKKS